MPWVFLGKKPSCDRKMHNLIPYRPCLWSDAQGSALPRAGPVRSLLLVPPAQKDEGGMNKPTRPGLCGHCQGRGEVREAKRWIFEEFQVRNQTGKNQSFCPCALGLDRKLAQNWLHIQNKKRKPGKTNFKSQKENCQNLTGPCISPKSLCLAIPQQRLPCCSAEELGSLCPFHVAMTVTGMGRGGWHRQLCCVLSSPAETPQAALLGGMPLKVTVHTDSLMSFAVQEPQVCLSPVPLLTRWALPQSHQELSAKAPQALLEILLTGLTLGSLLTSLYLPKPWNNLYLLCLTWNSRSQTSPPTLESPFPSGTTTLTCCHIPPWNVTEIPFLTLLLTCSSQISFPAVPQTPQVHPEAGAGGACEWQFREQGTRFISLHTRERSITPKRQSQKGFRQFRQSYCSTPFLSYHHIQDIFREFSELL